MVENRHSMTLKVEKYVLEKSLYVLKLLEHRRIFKKKSNLYMIENGHSKTLKVENWSRLESSIT